MNREDIVRMAREAFDVQTDSRGRTTFSGDSYAIERFAALVASAERERLTEAAMKAAEKAVDVAMALEREAIAQMIEDAPALMEFAQNDQGGCLMCGFTPKLAAETIRARGQA